MKTCLNVNLFPGQLRQLGFMRLSSCASIDNVNKTQFLNLKKQDTFLLASSCPNNKEMLF